MSFSYYVEPQTVIGEPHSETRRLYSGLGFDEETKTERAVVGIFEECDVASIELSRDDLEAVIVDLVHTLAAMGSDA